MPIFSTILAILIFGEKFMTFHLIGAIFIISGIIINMNGRNMTKCVARLINKAKPLQSQVLEVALLMLLLILSFD